MKILICSSKYFYHRIPKIRDFLEERGHVLKMPNSFNEPMMEEKLKSMGKEEHIKWKAEMMRRDEGNIEPQDAILVLNFEKNGIPNYIGGATFLEIYTAWKMRKKIFFYNPIPNCSFSDELVGMEPIVLNGELEAVR